MIEESIKALKTAGLSDKEAITYLDLQQYGESQTGKICERTNIPSSYIYSILEGLIKKGLVNYKIVNNIKIFRASDPEALKNLFEEKESALAAEKQELLSMIPKLKNTINQYQKINDFKYFEGIRGVKSLYTEITTLWNKGDEYYIASAPLESFSKLEGFFQDIVHKKRIRDNVKIKMIIDNNSRKYGKTRAKMVLSEVRYLDINTPTEYGVLNEYIFLITYGNEPYGLLIKDKNFAKTYKKYFELLWNIATP